jgi:hypothetical protein
MVPPYGDMDVAARVERERVDRLAQWLEATIGPRLTAYAAGVSTEDIIDVAHGGRVPDELDQRLRNLYALTYYLAATDGPGSAHEWLLSPNPELGNHAPAEVLHEGAPPEQVWVAAAPSF